jgi:hypothetical protein
MDNKKKICPLSRITPAHQLKQDCTCIESECAWWCEQTGSCAMTAIPDLQPAL